MNELDIWLLESIIGDYFDYSPTKVQEFLEKILKEIEELIYILQALEEE